MKNIIRHYLMIYWSKKAKMYNDIVKVYVQDIDGFDYIYVTGLAANMRDMCLRNVRELEVKK